MPYKIADIYLLMVPGLGGLSQDHWQARWVAGLSTARLIAQAEWRRPRCEDWVARIEEAVAVASRPVVLVGHGCGVSAVVHAAPRLPPGRVVGAFLVSPPDLAEPPGGWPAGDRRAYLAGEGGFAPVPSAPLPFPSLVVASRNDPTVEQQQARGFALDWGADFVDARDSGHIDVDSGNGPWPAGLMRLGAFLKLLA